MHFTYFTTLQIHNFTTLRFYNFTNPHHTVLQKNKSTEKQITCELRQRNIVGIAIDGQCGKRIAGAISIVERAYGGIGV